MIRLTLCSLALLGFGATARAGELDKELAPKAPATPVPAVVTPSAGSELDKESPEAAYRGRGGFGYGGGYRGYYGGYRGGYGGYGYRGYGYGGYGYRGYGYGGFYRPYYGIGYGYYPYYYGYNPYLYGGLYAGIGGGYYW